MNTRKIVMGVVLSLGLFGSGIMVGQNVSARRHPNLEQAQALIEQAMAKISSAQQYNEFDMNGHAAKAKDLLARAYNEIKAAAVTANRH